MSSLNRLVAIYPVLQSIASFISTRDLFYLALACKSNYSCIRFSINIFNALKRTCLCDGRGLAARQSFSGPFALYNFYNWGSERRIWEDEPIEVRLYNIKCEAEALPCQKCGINICEECRYYPREPPERPMRRPHLNSSWESWNVMCLCEDCDAKLGGDLNGKFLNELCDCDVFTRWICVDCKTEEQNFTRDYYDEHTELEGYGGTKIMADHQHSRDFYCLCGKSVPQGTRPRCTWCKRRHLPEDEWHREWDEVGSKMPIFENDPCYPPFIGSRYNPRCEVLYPTLPYDGPIYPG